MEAVELNGPSGNGFWEDRPTFVTGGTGLVGGWLVNSLLDKGADVVCLVRDHVPQSEFARRSLASRVKVVAGDVTDRTLLERVLGEYEIDTVIHLAAQTIVGIAARNPVSTFESNVAGTWSLLEACRRSPAVKQIVLASSDKAYGDQNGRAYSEDMPLQGRFPYDVSKSCADLIAQSYAATYNLPVAVTRCGNFYGGGDLNWNRLIPGTIRSLIRNKRPVIRSDGLFVRDYFYVEDGVAAYLLLVEKLAENPEFGGEAFNFSDETELTALDLVGLVTRVMGSDLEPDVKNEANHEMRHQLLSAEKARNLLGWHPQFSLEEGLQRTVTWYREFLNA